jgi:glycogen operon protein
VYCQDNELSWVDWSRVDHDLLEFTRSVLQLRSEHAVFRRRRFFTGEATSDGVPDIVWLNTDGTEMDHGQWTSDTTRPLGVLLNGGGITEAGTRGEQILDDTFLLLFNPGHEDVPMRLPDRVGAGSWNAVLDTARDVSKLRALRPGSRRTVIGRSVLVLRRG